MHCTFQIIQWSPENADSLHIFSPRSAHCGHWGCVAELSQHTIISPLATCAGVARVAAWC